MNQTQESKKVLCFHGFGTNADVLNFQLKQFKKEFDNFEFVTQDGPVAISKKVFMDERLAKVIEKRNIYSWGSWFRLKSNNYYETFGIAIEQAVKTLQEKGPFYAIMGFSQGSNMVSKLSDLIHSGEVKLDYRIQCFIFVSGIPFQSQQQTKPKLYKTPSLHFIGVNDFMADQSITLASQYLNPFIVYHNQGHKIPTLTYEQIKQIRKFLDQKETEEWSTSVYVPKL